MLGSVCALIIEGYIEGWIEAGKRVVELEKYRVEQQSLRNQRVQKVCWPVLISLEGQAEHREPVQKNHWWPPSRS